mmetsp:Transcript_110973/g.318869  ORF Transcript_110973/g.318869 Transcript_110973/m.318869 type:complete len:130 (-) Transcript_110973:105-494(-)|eukprot:CAMPEP_0170244502 /NCGR_PEP_ID=MMETSP0116_2-20130129/22031_1 /TAXON_ID=400756 /ORGANISM="Durinskia baltica, Strain CSIRO CS-38" /LENGTH=129 /DNA_ID=CAMNT_0010495365 /DNA_START=41 /DNA_END=430 /DNA_ORIENTATION=+
MKTALILSSLLVGAQSFGVVPVTQGRVATQLYAAISEENMTSDQKEIRDIQNKWNEIRLLDRETAQKELSGEWLEAYNRYFEKYDDDMQRMSEYTQRLEKMIEPPKVAKKTKGQRKRDAYARVLARSGN